MAKNHPLFHKLKSVIGYSIATVVIIVALGVSGLRFILTTANLYHDEVEELASSLLEQPVKIGRMDAKLSGLTPTLIFHEVQLVSKQKKQPLFSLSRIDVGISFEALFLQQKIIPTQLIIRGMDLRITRTVEGKFKVEGIDLDGLTAAVDDDKKYNSIFERWLLLQSEITVENSSIVWKDEQNSGLRWVFDDVNFLLKNSNVHHQLSLTGKLPNVLGDKIKLELDISGDITQPSLWIAQLFIESKKINLKPVRKYIKNKYFKLNEGSVGLKLWADLDRGELNKLSGDVNLHGITYNIKGDKQVDLNFVSAIFDSRKDEDNTWNVSVDKFNYKNNERVWPESKFSLAFNYKNDKVENLYVKADYLKLGVLAQIVKDNHLIKNKKYLNDLNIHGDIRDFHVAWQENTLHKLKADFTGFSSKAWKNLPAVKNISGRFSFENNNGQLSLLSKNAVVAFPHLFRQEFKLNDLSAEIAFLYTNEGFLFEVERLVTENTEVKAVSVATLWVPKSDVSPYLDFQTYVSNGDASKVSHYLPVEIMSDALVNWLDQGIVGGQVDKGTVIFSGKLNDFPFTKHDGVFAVDIETSNVVVNYINGWPKIEKAKINGGFTGRGMKLHLLTAEVENNLLYDSYAEINSFAAAELQLNLAAKGTAHNSMQYIVNSPILPAARSVVESMRLLGDVVAKVKINMPLNSRIKKEKSLSYSGTASIHNTSVYMLKDKLELTGLTGNILFNEKKLTSHALTAKILGEEAKLLVVTLPKNKGIQVAVNGKINPGEILGRFDIPGAKNISGSAPFQGDMTFPGKDEKFKQPVLSLTSNLLGVGSVLPEFLHKRKNIKQDLKFKTIFMGKKETQFELDFNGKGSAVFEVNESGKGVPYLNKGAVSISNNKAIMPGKNILYIDGTINKFTPFKWAEALGINKPAKSQPFFINPIVLNLDELKIFTDSKITKQNVSYLNPATMPKFEGIIKKLSFDNVFLGRLDFKTSQQRYGMHLDELILSARNMKLVAYGDWHYNRGNHKTDVDVTLSSKNFGGMLTDLGFSKTIEKGAAQTVGKLYWQGAPSQFSLKALNGSVQLNVENGNIIDVDAGAGRLLGFFSLAALPRKLFGDFKETFESGFSFDKAKGEIIIDDGDVYTDNFKINSPVAKITLSGRTGLVARDYENIVEVIPDVGSGLTGMIALLVNLPAGIGLWLMDQITGEQFNEASMRTYKVSGSWDDPKTELMEQK